MAESNSVQEPINSAGGEIPNPETLLKVRSFGVSLANPDHPEDNQDSFLMNQDEEYAVVCDGMGEEKNPAAAGRAACDYIGIELSTLQSDDPEVVKQLMAEILQRASKQVISKAPGGGTTATAVKFLDDTDGRKIAIIGHVGDSRAYLVRGGEVTQITEDDGMFAADVYFSAEGSPVRQTYGASLARLDAMATKEDFDALTPEEQKAFKQRNILAKYLGGYPFTPQIYQLTLSKGDKIILTTDGESANLATDERNEIFLNSQTEDIPEAIVQEARKRSDSSRLRAHYDDIIVVAVEVGEF